MADAELNVSSIEPVAGFVGTTVTIMGTGFSQTSAKNTVSLCGLLMLITSASEENLQVIVPELPNGSSANIVVNVGNQTCASNELFTVVG